VKVLEHAFAMLDFAAAEAAGGRPGQERQTITSGGA
jgi:hypothetical protein